MIGSMSRKTKEQRKRYGDAEEARPISSFVAMVLCGPKRGQGRGGVWVWVHVFFLRLHGTFGSDFYSPSLQENRE